jgi:signal transduction histidine kinase
VSLLAKETSSTPAEPPNTSDGADAPVAQRGRKWVVVEVADTGVGIPPERLGSIFEPFHTSKESGTGLGLAIVKQKVEELGGRISVTSSQGTRFTLELPVLGRA